MYGKLQHFVERPRFQAAFAQCPSLTVSDHRALPYARFFLDAKPGTVTSVDIRWRKMLSGLMSR